jgi:hypothetical protein
VDLVAEGGYRVGSARPERDKGEQTFIGVVAHGGSRQGATCNLLDMSPRGP